MDHWTAGPLDRWTAGPLNRVTSLVRTEDNRLAELRVLAKNNASALAQGRAPPAGRALRVRASARSECVRSPSGNADVLDQILNIPRRRRRQQRYCSAQRS